MDRDDVIDQIIADLSLSINVHNGKLWVSLKIGDRVISKDFVHLSDIQED